MYSFNADFRRCDDKQQPYSFYFEKNSNLRHFYGKIENGEYIINCTGGRNFIMTPDLQRFTLNSEIAIIKPMLDPFAFGFYFGYDYDTRAGNLVTMQYSQTKKIFSVILYRIDVNRKTEIERVSFENVMIEEEKYLPLTLDVSEEYCKISLNGIEVSFNHAFGKGQVALTKEIGGAGYRVKSLSIVSNDEIKLKKLYSGEFTLPKYDGADEPYELGLEILSYENGLREINVKLYGGIEFAKKNDPKNKMWSSKKDKITNPYVRFIGDCTSKKMYLRSGGITFVDDVNINSAKISAVNYADPTPKRDRPFENQYSTFDFDDFKYFIFGYDHIERSGHSFEGDEAEYVFDKQQNLVYFGDKLERECIIKVSSIKNEMEELVRRNDFVLKEDALIHVKNNHYFTTNENPSFNISIFQDDPIAKVETRVYLANAFFKKIKDLSPSLVNSYQNEFSKNVRELYVTMDKLDQSVYHLIIECYRGEKLIKKHESAFEVFDPSSTLSPIESAHLPFIFVGDSAFTLPTTWSHKPDFNIVHYVDTTVGGPREYEAKKMWEQNKLYRRKSLVWFTQRTTARDTYLDHIDCVKNADYIYYLYPGIEDSGNYYRFDHFHKNLFEAKPMRRLYNEFCDLHTEYKLEKLEVDSEDMYDFGYARFKALEGVFDEWVDFVNPKIEEMFQKQWAEVLKVNPNVKRYSYGPFNAYATRAVGGEVMKYFGHPENVVAKRFAFVQYEDYAFCCNYPLAYSTWGMTTSRLLAKGLVMGPEIYDSFDAGCPDGHVAFPSPPFSVSYAPPYQTVSQIYAYLYNSVYHSNDGFKYWNDGKLMLLAAYNHEPKERYKAVISAWGTHLENKPKVPKKTVCYLYKRSDKDNEFELEHEGSVRSVMQNKCAIAMTYIYTRLSELGIPAGFPTDNVFALTENDIDVLVIPSTYALTSEEVTYVRELYNKGVKLIATGDITGFEDIFGVKKNAKFAEVSLLHSGREKEHILPFKAEFLYESDGAIPTLFEGDECHPVLLKTDKTLLINTSLGVVGAENFTYVHVAGGRENVSELIRKHVNSALIDLTSPVIRAYGDAYANIFESENGSDEIMLYQCTDYEKNNHLIRVEINTPSYCDVVAIDDDERCVNKIFENGKLSEFELTLRPRETMLFKLVK
jgi:hypothetical protein